MAIVDRNEAESAFRALIRVYGLIRRIMQPYFGRMGISGSQWGVLRTLYRSELEGCPGLRILELGNRLLVRPPSVSGLVNRLRWLGYIKLIPSRTDLRCKEVFLTTAGRALVERILQTHTSQIELLMNGLDKAELQKFYGHLDRLGNHLDDIVRNQDPGVPQMVSAKEPDEFDSQQTPR